MPHLLHILAFRTRISIMTRIAINIQKREKKVKTFVGPNNVTRNKYSGEDYSILTHVHTPPYPMVLV